MTSGSRQPRFVVSDDLMLSEVGGLPVGMIRGQVELHFFEGTAGDVLHDLAKAGATFADLLRRERQRFPDQDPRVLAANLRVFLNDAISKGVVVVVG